MSMPWLLGAAFRLAATTFPAELRGEVGSEMGAAFEEALRARHRRAGGRAALAYAIRSLIDVVGAGLRERLRRPGPSGARGSIRKGDHAMRELWTDLRQGGRRLRRSPGFTLAAVSLLALGIGANTAVFSALKATLLAPPPYPEPERLVWLELELGATEAEAATLPWSWRKFELLREGSAGTLASVAGYGLRPVTLAGDGADPSRLMLEVVSADYFETLRVPMAAGRSFGPAELVENGPRAAVLGHGLWQERFGGDRDIIGRVVTLNDQGVTVIGVAAAGFEGLSGAAQGWVPAPTAAQLISPVMLRAHAHWMFGFGRLAEGVETATVATRLAGVATAVVETYPLEGTSGHAAVSAIPLTEARANATSRTALLVLMGAAAMVLLISCANLAGLLLARARRRARDAAIRLSLGSGRARVIRAALAEAGLLAAAGALAGLVLAQWGLRGIRAVWPQRFLQPGATPLRSVDLELFRLDGAALLFALGATVLTALLFGLIPALRQARVPVQEALRDGAGATARHGTRRGLAATPSLLVAAQTALALVLLVGAGLMLRTLTRLQDVSAGFDTEGMVVMDVTIPRGSPDFADPVPLRERVMERLQALPGVESATFGCAPLNGPCWTAGVTGLDGREVDLETGIGVHGVPDNFFEALRVPVRSGRTFGPQDRKGGPPVVILNELAARELFGGASPLGRTVALTVELTSEGRQAEVVGVVGNVVQGRPDEGATPQAYFSERQMADGIALMVRARGEPLEVIEPVRAAVREVAPGVVVDAVRTMRDVRSRALGETRVVLMLLGLFAVTAVVLAGAGIWAIVALTVAERRRELGLRMALGARATQIVAMVVRQGVAAALAGALVGVWAAWGLSRLLTGLLFETDAHEPAAFIGAVLVLLAGAALASVLPARRATRVDPARTLRAD